MSLDQYYYYKIRLADTIVPAAFRYQETVKLFGRYSLGKNESDTGIRVPDHELDLWKSYGLEESPHYEYSCFTAAASDYLSQYDRFIVHAVAVRWHDHAYLIAAPSGEGKSTMLRTLQGLYPGEFSVICGDRPVLAIEKDNEIIVYPSPWNGKENWYGAKKAPLRGFVCLHRGTDNSFLKLKAKEAAVPVFTSLIQTKETKELIHKFSSFSETIIKSVPVWKFISGGVPDSAVFLYDNLFSHQEI